jgi:photosystem II stability/assembly factor-like uncharacterized protein
VLHVDVLDLPPGSYDLYLELNRVGVSGSSTPSLNFGAPDGGGDLGAEQSFNLLFPSDFRGAVHLVLAALNQTNQVIAQVETTADPDVEPGQVRYVTLDFDAPVDGGLPGDLAGADLSPPSLVQFKAVTSTVIGGAQINGIWGATVDDVYICTEDGEVARSIDAGHTWSWASTGAGMLYGIWGLSSTDVTTVGYGGAMYHTSDGNTWNPLSSRTPGHLSAIHLASPASMFAVGYDTNGGLFDVSQNGGIGWSVHTGLEQLLYAVHAYGTCNAVGVGENGYATAIHCDGIDVTLGNLDTTPLDGVWTSDGTSMWAVGAAGTIRHSFNGGGTWDGQTIAGGPQLFAITGFAGGDDLWVVGQACTVLRSTDRGVTWVQQGCPATSYHLHALWGRDASSLYLAGVDSAGGVVLHP